MYILRIRENSIYLNTIMIVYVIKDRSMNFLHENIVSLFLSFWQLSFISLILQYNIVTRNMTLNIIKFFGSIIASFR